MKIISVVGARPNFMKIAPLAHAIEQHNASTPGTFVEHKLVHTGQHYDVRMSEGFFRELNIPAPDINLEIGSGSHAEQVGRTMIAFEKVLLRERPDWVVVLGDVNATLACSVTAKKLCISVCHIEAGLRSGDMTMPEEINRLVTDRLSDLLLTPDTFSSLHLFREGVLPEKVRFVGNIMIDTLEANREKAAAFDLDRILEENSLLSDGTTNLPDLSGGFALLTMHRPSNVDSVESLAPILDFLTDEATTTLPVVWPIHPRTRNMLLLFGLWDKVVACPGLVLLQPLGYHEMLRLNIEARLALTDSGGLQEECCVLGTPCLTLRWSTERPVTLQEHGGASVLVGNNVQRIREEFRKTLGADRVPKRPELWDGHTADRCLAALLEM